MTQFADEVSIGPWKADQSYTHVYKRPWHTATSGRRGDVVQMSVGRVVEIGLVTGKLTPFLAGYRLSQPCDEFLRDVKLIDEYTVGQIADARGQLEDADFDVADLSDTEIAYLDWYALELWSEAALEVSDPFRDKVTIQSPVTDYIGRWLSERGEKHRHADEAARESENDTRRGR